MKRNNSQLALGTLVVLLGACTPSGLITPAQQTAVAATAMAAANSVLTPAGSTQTAAPSTTATGSFTTSSPAVPVTGGTSPAITSTPSAGTTTNSTGSNGTNGTSGSNGSTGATGSGGFTTTSPSNSSGGSNGSTGVIPNTGATSTVSGTTTTAGSANGCGGTLNVGAAGQTATVWINNDSSNPVNFTMGLASANSFGQCGFMTWGPIKAGQSLRVAVPVTQTTAGDACYWAYATMVHGGNPSSVVTGQSGGYCITAPQRWVINIHNDRIRLVGP